MDRVERKKLLMGLFAVFLMATSTVGFVLSLGTFQPSSFTYDGTCLAEINAVSSKRALVYTLKDVNIPGTRNGPYIETVLTEDVLKTVKENNLLYWTDAVVETEVKGVKIRGTALVLGTRKPGDAVLLRCSLVVENGVPTYFEAMEIPG